MGKALKGTGGGRVTSGLVQTIFIIHTKVIKTVIDHSHTVLLYMMVTVMSFCVYAVKTFIT